MSQIRLYFDEDAMQKQKCGPTSNTCLPGGVDSYFGAPLARSFLITFPPFITNLTR
jgi:hypothetical protein